MGSYTSTSMGKDTFYTYLRRFGFGALTQVDLASEGPGMMKLPGDSNWFPSDLGTNSNRRCQRGQPRHADAALHRQRVHHPG